MTIRTISGIEPEYRTLISNIDEQKYVAGYGVVYDAPLSVELRSQSGKIVKFSETICAGAAKASNAEIRCCVNHNSDYVLATTSSNPVLEIEYRSNGVYYKAPIPPTTYGRDLEVNLGRGNVRGASIKFRVPANGDTYERRDDGSIHRKITDILIESIDPVGDPAYKDTSAVLRDSEGIMQEIEKLIPTTAASESSVAAINKIKNKRRLLKIKSQGAL